MVYLYGCYFDLVKLVCSDVLILVKFVNESAQNVKSICIFGCSLVYKLMYGSVIFYSLQLMLSHQSLCVHLGKGICRL